MSSRGDCTGLTLLYSTSQYTASSSSSSSSGSNSSSSSTSGSSSGSSSSSSSSSINPASNSGSESDCERLYPGSDLTTRQMILLIYRLLLNHRMSLKSIDSLLKLLDLALPSGSTLPKSMYFLQKHMQSLMPQVFPHLSS